jgi:hypothetical protein
MKQSATSAREILKPRQMALSHSIFPRLGLVRKLRWAHDGLFELAFSKDSFHCRCIDDQSREEQPAEKACGRQDRILEQESLR